MKRNRRIIPALASTSAAVLLLLPGAAPQDQPAVTRLDPALLMVKARMEQEAAVGTLQDIPLIARRDGVVEGPRGIDDPWIDILIRGPGASSAIRRVSGENVSRLGMVRIARVPLHSVVEIAESPGIEWVEASTISRPLLDVSVPETHADLVHGTGYGYKGAGTLVAIYDSGIDFTHEDFRNPDGTTRIKAIWDQTDNLGTPPTGYAYGSEWTEAQINDEIDGTPAGLINQQDTNGHGTHVAGIAAGNGRATGNSQPSGRHVGMAPEADILVIKGGDGTFFSTMILQGVEWAVSKASSLGQPVVINLSLGGHNGAHDGTSNYEIGLDSAVGPGKVIVAAAGNEGNDQIHSHIELFGTNIDSFSLEIPAYTPQSDNGNDYVKMDTWYDGTASAMVTVKAPGGAIYGPWNPGDNFSLEQPEGNVSCASTAAPVATNGDHNIVLVIDDATVGQEPAVGTWWVIFEVGSGDVATVDTWIYENTIDADITGATADYTVAVPGTAVEIITTGSYVSKWSWTAIDDNNYYYGTPDRTNDYSTFSSWGPTRDGRIKPEISAPGQGIFSAWSINMTAPPVSNQDLDGVHRLSQGTSQASPHVTGAVALLLEANPYLTASEAKDHLINSTRTDSHTGSVPNTIWGYGKLDAKGAMDLVITAVDSIAPTFTFGWLRNTVIPDWLDIYMFPSEVLADTPTVFITRAATTWDTLTIDRVSTQERDFWVTDFQIPSSGTYTLHVEAGDPAGNDTTITRDFSAAQVTGAGGILVSPDGIMHASFSSGSVRNGGYVIATEYLARAGRDPTDAEEGISPAYQLIPDGEILDRNIKIEFSFDPGRLGSTPPTALGIYRLEEGGWIPVESYVDVNRRRVEASIGKLGIYQLRAGGEDGQAGLSFGLEQNYPNPFNGTTQIRFTLAHPTDVELYVLNVRGQRVRTLVNGYESAGRHVVTWDGRNEGGGRLASGVYLLFMKVNGRVFTRKVLLLQ